MKILISKQVCDFVAAGLQAQEACAAAVRLLTRRVDGRGGVIAVDTDGNIGLSYNTFAMPFAYVVGDSTVIVSS